MKELARILTNPVRLKKAMKGVTAEQILRSIELMNEILETRKDEEVLIAKEKEEKKKKIDELLTYMTKLNIKINELPKVIKREPKYKIVVTGKGGSTEERLWSGVGRTPNVFKKAIKEGNSLDDYLI